MKFWKPNENYTKLTHHWYFENYLQATSFILYIGKINDSSTVKQHPSISIMNKDLLTVELTTPKLKGLSGVDFEYAIQISLIPAKEFKMTPVTKNKGYRRELRIIGLEEEEKN